MTWANSAEIEFALENTDSDLATSDIVNAGYGTHDTINAYQAFFVLVRVPLARDIADYRIQHTHNANVRPDHVYSPLVGSSGAWSLVHTDATYRYYLHAGHLQLHNSDVLQVQKANVTVHTAYEGGLSRDRVLEAITGLLPPTPSGARRLLRTNQAGNAYELLNADDAFFNVVFRPSPIFRGQAPSRVDVYFRVVPGVFPDANRFTLRVNGVTSGINTFDPNSANWHTENIDLTSSQQTSWNIVVRLQRYMQFEIRLYHDSTTDYTYYGRVPVLEGSGYPIASKAEAEDPNDATVREFSPQRIHQAIDTILPPVEHGYIKPAGIANINSIAGDYTVVLGNTARTIASANQILIQFQGLAVHSGAWTVDDKIFNFNVNATEANDVRVNLNNQNPVPDQIQVSLTFRNGANVLDVLNLYVGIGHEVLQEDEPLSLRYDLVHSENYDIKTTNTITSTGWTIPETGLFEFYFNDDNNDTTLIVTAQALRAAAIESPRTTATISSLPETLVFRIFFLFDLHFFRTSANILLFRVSAAVDAMPLTIRRLL